VITWKIERRNKQRTIMTIGIKRVIRNWRMKMCSLCMEHPMVTHHDALERSKLYEQWFVNGGNRTTYIDV